MTLPNGHPQKLTTQPIWLLFFIVTCVIYLSFTKMGFAGNNDPSFIQPTVIATRDGGASSSAPSVPSKPSFLNSSASSNLASKRGIEDLDFFIGDEAVANSKTYALNYPIRHGQIDNWDHMERYWEQSIFKYLRCEPEDHYFLLVRFIIGSKK